MIYQSPEYSSPEHEDVRRVEFPTFNVLLVVYFLLVLIGPHVMLYACSDGILLGRGCTVADNYGEAASVATLAWMIGVPAVVGSLWLLCMIGFLIISGAASAIKKLDFPARP